MFCPVDIQSKTNQLRTRAPLRVAVGQLRTTPSRLKNIAYRRVHSPPPGTTSALVVDAFLSAAWPPGGGGQLVSLFSGRTSFCFGVGRSRCSLLPSSFLRVVQVARAFVLDNPGPLVPSRFIIASSARKFQVRNRLSFRFASFSRLRPVSPRRVRS